MKITKKENYIILKGEKGKIPDFATYLSTNHSTFKGSNVVIDLLDHRNPDSKDLLAFLEISNLHSRGKKSFVIAAREVDVEEIPEDLMVVPTLVEAEDVINMEELEREMGF